MHGSWLLLALISCITSVAGKEDHASDLLDWIKKCGGSVSSELQVQKSAYAGRGLYANGELDASSLMISLPFNCSLSVDIALRETKGLGKLQHYIEQNQTAKSLVSGNVLLSAFVMLRMKSGQGRFSVYLQDLRKRHQSTVMGLPWLWTSDELAELTGTRTLEAVNVCMALLVNEYAVIAHALPKLTTKHTLGDYIVAASLVNSRSFGSSPALLPGIDLANHFLPEPDSFLTKEDLDEFVSKTRRTILVRNDSTKFFEFRVDRRHRSEEVFNQYGLASNTHFLTMYGFVVPWIHNLTCLAETSLELPVEDLLAMPFAQPWVKTRIETGVSLKMNSCSGSNIHDILAFARLWSSHASWADVHADCDLTASAGSTSTQLSKWRLHLSCPHISRKDELAALGLVRSLVAARRSQMLGGSVQDEEALIADASTPQRLRVAATIRRDEKYVLQKADQFLSRAREQLKQAGADWRSYLSVLLPTRDAKSCPRQSCSNIDKQAVNDDSFKGSRPVGRRQAA